MGLKLLPRLKEIWKTKGNECGLPKDRGDHTVKLQGALAKNFGSKRRIVKIRIEEAKRLEIQRFHPFFINAEVRFCDFEGGKNYAIGKNRHFLFSTNLLAFQVSSNMLQGSFHRGENGV